VPVDVNGCPVAGASIILEGVTFATNSAEIAPGSLPVLEKVATGLKTHPDIKVEIQGHTDSTGSAQYNMGLSQRRAESVLDYLVKAGVSSGQVTARGYGATMPVASNSTAEGRARNRRVVMYVASNPGAVKVEKQGTTE
jgi:OOP family OmpA-OmpF porin